MTTNDTAATVTARHIAVEYPPINGSIRMFCRALLDIIVAIILIVVGYFLIFGGFKSPEKIAAFLAMYWEKISSITNAEFLAELVVVTAILRAISTGITSHLIEYGKTLKPWSGLWIADRTGDTFLVAVDRTIVSITGILIAVAFKTGGDAETAVMNIINEYWHTVPYIWTVILFFGLIHLGQHAYTAIREALDYILRPRQTVTEATS